MSKYNWPTREEWAIIQRTVYYDNCDLGVCDDISDYASPAEVEAALVALRAVWCSYGRKMKVAKSSAGPAGVLANPARKMSVGIAEG
jgi:hypothetical protein